MRDDKREVGLEREMEEGRGRLAGKRKRKGSKKRFSQLLQGARNGREEERGQGTEWVKGIGKGIWMAVGMKDNRNGNVRE